MAPAFGLLLKRPTQLHLYPEETYGTVRPVAAVQAPAFAVADMPQMAHYVHQRACMVVQAMAQYAAIAAPPREVIPSLPAEAEADVVAITSDANEVEAQTTRDEPEAAPLATASEPVAQPSAEIVEPVQTDSSSKATEELPKVAAPIEDVPVPVPAQHAESNVVEGEKKTPKRKRDAAELEAEDAPETPNVSNVEAESASQTPQTAGTPSGKAPASMTVPELKAALSALGLDTKGLKKDLLQRYIEALEK